MEAVGDDVSIFEVVLVSASMTPFCAPKRALLKGVEPIDDKDTDGVATRQHSVHRHP